ncbi:MAG: universal stress protein [Mycobacterium sp.]
MDETDLELRLPAAENSAPVMVGIDGSQSSLRAAVWATDEAIARDTSLRLVHVVSPGGSEHLDTAMADAHRALHRAWEIVVDTGKPVKLESEILEGEPVEELVEASRRAVLLCVGHKGAKDSGALKRGATARAVARRAHCSTAVVRRRGPARRPRSHRWIVAILDESPDSHGVLETAVVEALRHEAPIFALTSWSTTMASAKGERISDKALRANVEGRLERARRDPTAVQMCALPMPHHLLHVLKQAAHVDQMVIVADSQQHAIEELMSDRAHAALRKSSCSLLILRSPASSVGSATA